MPGKDIFTCLCLSTMAWLEENPTKQQLLKSAVKREDRLFCLHMNGKLLYLALERLKTAEKILENYLEPGDYPLD